MKPIVTSRKKRGKVLREMGRSLKTYGQKGKGEDWAGFWDSVKSGEALREAKRLMGTTVRASVYKGQKGKGGLISPGAWYQMGETSQKGLGKRKRSQEGGFAFGPYTQGLSGIEKKRRTPQKLHKIPNWERYKG